MISRSITVLGLLAFAVVGGTAWELLRPGEAAAPIAATRATPHTDPLQMAKSLHGHTEGVRDVAFSGDGKVLASASLDHTVKLWDVGTGKLVRTLEGHSRGVDSVSFSRDGKYLVSGGDDMQAILWNAATGEIERIWNHPYAVGHVAFLPDGKRVVTTCFDTIRVFKVGEDAVERQMEDPSAFTCLVVSQGGKVATGDRGGKIVLWDVMTGRPLRYHTREATDDGNPRNAVIWAEFVGEDLLRFVDMEAVWRWDLKADKITVEWPDSVQATCSFDGGRLMFEGSGPWLCTRDSTLTMHETRQGGATVGRMAVSPKEDFVAVARGAHPSAMEWMSEGPQDVELYSLEAVRKRFEEVAASPTERQRERAVRERAETQTATSQRATQPATEWH